MVLVSFVIQMQALSVSKFDVRFINVLCDPINNCVLKFSNICRKWHTHKNQGIRLDLKICVCYALKKTWPQYSLPTEVRGIFQEC